MSDRAFILLLAGIGVLFCMFGHSIGVEYERNRIYQLCLEKNAGVIYQQAVQTCKEQTGK